MGERGFEGLQVSEREQRINALLQYCLYTFRDAVRQRRGVTRTGGDSMFNQNLLPTSTLLANVEKGLEEATMALVNLREEQGRERDAIGVGAAKRPVASVLPDEGPARKKRLVEGFERLKAARPVDTDRTEIEKARALLARVEAEEASADPVEEDPDAPDPDTEAGLTDDHLDSDLEGEGETGGD